MIHPACRVAVVVLACACTCAGFAVGATAAGAPVEAVVDQPRPFGHVIGDVLTQRVLLEQHGQAFEPATLPAASRLGVWFERRAARMESAADGRHWLVVDYQVVNARSALTTVRLPGWDIAGRGDTPPLRVAAWDVSVAPLASPAGTDGVALRPDHPAPVIDTGPMRRRLLWLATALAACLAAWAGWLGWRAWRATATQPFARALRALNGQDETTPPAWRALHEAFDRTGGQVIRSATLPCLFERAPHLAPLRLRIERFYAQSEALFFGGALPADALSPRALCRDLRRLERAAEP